MRRLAVLVLALSAVLGCTHAQAQNRKYVIYFQEWSAAIDDSAQGVIKEVADAARQQRGKIDVVGFADPTGSKAANLLLSDLRARRVADLLTDAGVPSGRLVLRGKGPVHYAGTSQESRRVEISFESR
jgi:outer membrane protein OmpA-like peptidoglycan-associated protein